MTGVACALLAVLSIWEYPARYSEHVRLRDQLVESIRGCDAERKESICRRGVELLPDNPIWHYNLACALASGADADASLDELERAIDLGFRDFETIRRDADFMRIAGLPRFRELVRYAERMKGSPMMVGPFATLPATGVFGRTVTIAGENLQFDFDHGCFRAQLTLSGDSSAGNAGDLYLNLDRGHSMLGVTNWPGLTRIRLDEAGRRLNFDLDYPSMVFPYPVFGNASRAFVSGLWRSLPRAMMTTERHRLMQIWEMYVNNQIWIYPATADYPPVGTNGDVFASVTPYWLVTQGRSWSDQYYLEQALEASRSFDPEVKRELCRRGLLAPTVQALLRRSLTTVASEADYLTARAHPTCFPPRGVDTAKLKRLAAELKADGIPPVALIAKVMPSPVSYDGKTPELTYATPCAWAFVLRADATNREFVVRAAGGAAYDFAAVHDEKGAARLERLSGDSVRIAIDRSLLTPTNRVDLAVFARSRGSSWGAPSFVSFAVLDPSAPYSDPALEDR